MHLQDLTMTTSNLSCPVVHHTKPTMDPRTPEESQGPSLMMSVLSHVIEHTSVKLVTEGCAIQMLAGHDTGWRT